MRIGNRLIAQRVEMGALNQLYAAVDPDAQSGKFYGPDGFGKNRGYPTEVQPIRISAERGDRASAMDALGRAHRRDLEAMTGSPSNTQSISADGGSAEHFALLV